MTNFIHLDHNFSGTFDDIHRTHTADGVFFSKEHASDDIDWWGTLRGRAGWAFDRFLVYGVDVCTTSNAGSNPRCGCGGPGQPACPTTNNNINYIWPEGCPQRPDQLGPFAQLKESGCPAFPRNSDGSFAAFGSTARDNAADTYILQGGRIRMGGFALGFGFKFSF